MPVMHNMHYSTYVWPCGAACGAGQISPSATHHASSFFIFHHLDPPQKRWLTGLAVPGLSVVFVMCARMTQLVTWYCACINLRLRSQLAMHVHSAEYSTARVHKEVNTEVHAMQMTHAECSSVMPMTCSSNSAFCAYGIQSNLVWASTRRQMQAWTQHSWRARPKCVEHGCCTNCNPFAPFAPCQVLSVCQNQCSVPTPLCCS